MSKEMEMLEIILRNIKAGAVTIHWVEQYIEHNLKGEHMFQIVISVEEVQDQTGVLIDDPKINVIAAYVSKTDGSGKFDQIVQAALGLCEPNDINRTKRGVAP